MKKLSFLILFAFPFLLNAQYGNKNCHIDLVFGFDLGGSFNSPNADRPFFTEDFIYGYRIGTNLNYPIADRVQLVTGFRLSDRVMKTYETSLILHEAYTEKKLHDFFAEVPFRARYVLSQKKENRFYLEGGLDVNIYIASHAKDNIEQVFGRAENYNPFGLSMNLAPGFEMESNQTDISYFVQPIIRVQVTPKIKKSDLRFYHIGIETGIRF